MTRVNKTKGDINKTKGNVNRPKDNVNRPKGNVNKTKGNKSSNKSFDRMDRIADLMHRSIAKILREEFKDPRIGWVTIVSVEVSRDLAHAKVYVTVLEEEKVTLTLELLNKASGFFRSHLADLMHLRIVPKPHFIYDESIVRGTRILSLLDNSKNSETE